MPVTPAFWNNVQVNVHTTGQQVEPSITQLSTGHILVVWTDRDNGGAVGGSQPEYDIIGRVFDPTGVAVTGEILLNQFTADSERDPSVVALPNGGFALGYWASATGTDQLYLQEHAFNPATSSITRSNTQVIPSADGVSALQLASNDAGMVFGTYSFKSNPMDPGSLSYALGFTYNSVSNAFSSLDALHTGAMGGGTMMAPDVVALSNGNFAFAIQDPGAQSILFQVRDMTGDGLNAGTVYSGSPAFQPQIAALPGGGFVASYMRHATGTSDVFFKVYNAAGTLIGAENQAGQITHQLNNQDRNFVFGLPDGTFVVSWADQELDQLRAQRYSISGNAVTKLGNEFVIGTQDAGIALGYHEIEVLADGRFAVSWASPEDIRLTIFDPRDTPGTDVYAPDSWRVGTVGNDTISSAAKRVSGWVGNDTITEIAAAGSNKLTGDAGNDTLKLKSALDNDIFDGGAGLDTIDFTLSAQRGLNIDLTTGKVRFGAASETIAGFEHVVATIGADTLRGSALANTLNAGSGNDTLLGLAGNDTLIGGLGKDTMTGGVGSDTFKFELKTHSVVGTNADRIVDFDDGGAGDRIDLSALLGPVLVYRHALAFTAAGQVRINDIAGADVIVEVNTGGTLAADFSIRLVGTTLASMGRDDFIL